MAEKRKTTRRQFLLVQSAADAINDSPPANADTASNRIQPAQVANSQATYLIEIARHAMACDFAVHLNAGEHSQGPEMAVKALDLVDSLEDQMTVYRDHSEITKINDTASSDPVVVESFLFSLLQRAVELHRQTNGAFDITAGPLSRVWGFRRRQGHIPSQPELQEALDLVGSEMLRLNAEQNKVQFEKQGVEINLGAIGKGYALDRCTDLLMNHGVENFLIHGGQSSVAARGNRSGGPSNRHGWTVGLKHPIRPEQKLAEFHLRDQALGTSGSATQSFRYQGRRFGHILDPRTGQPAQGVLSATAIAESAAIADALSTAFYVMGAEQAILFCRQHDDVAAVIVTEAERSGAVNLHLAGLRDDDWECHID